MDGHHGNPDAKRLPDPSLQGGVVVLTAIEYIWIAKPSKEASDYIERLSFKDIKWKTRQDFLDEMTLLHADKDTPSKLPPNPTDEQRAAERQRRLNARTTRHRIIFSTWPRDPQTKHVIKSGSENTIMGKTAIEGRQLWAASLFDFYTVQRHPSITRAQTLSTSSKLLEFVKSVGEDHAVARPMVERAEREEDPKIVEPFDIARLIQNEEIEINVYMRVMREKPEDKREDKPEEAGDPSIRVNEDKSVGEAKEKEVGGNAGEEKHEKDSIDGKEEKTEENKLDSKEVTNDNKSELKAYSGPYPIESPFSPSCYPEGWMREPFSGEDDFQWRLTDTPPNLQQYLPQTLLPKKLVVHDPRGVLEATRKKSHKIRWSYLEDITYTYTLSLSTFFTDRKHEEDMEAEKEDAYAKRRLQNFLANPHSETERPPGYEKVITEPTPDGDVAVIYVVLPEVPRPQPAEEAHVYLLPSKDLGMGHHSCVYNAEFEVPRSLLVKEELCMDCVHADVEEQLKERAADLKNARQGKMSIKEETKKPLFLSDGSDNVYIFDLGGLGKEPQAEYTGPYDVVVQTRVGYQNLERSPYCQHLSARENAVHPLTAKVSVAAKLSIQYDRHLQAEALNYQRFPKHFFQHWSGFNLVRPSQYPVPLGPIVPQFYGYYVPEKAGTNDYLSPILLLEKCGEQISAASLSIDDSQECASLFYRLHESGWVHGSVYERNILKQPGPLNAAPNERLANTMDRGGYGVNWSFRLIDFGRTEYVGDKKDAEEWIEFDAKKIVKWMRGDKQPFTDD